MRRMSSSPEFLKCGSGARLAHLATTGSASLPTVIYVPGFMSGKDGDKAKHLDQFCKQKGYSFVRLEFRYVSFVSIVCIWPKV